MDEPWTAVRLSTGDRVVVALGGTLDFATALRLRFALYSRIDAGCRQVVLDLSEVSRMDTCSAGALERVHRDLARLGGTVRLVGVTGVELAALDGTGADRSGTGAGRSGTDAGADPLSPPRVPEPWAFEVTDVLHTRYHLDPHDPRRVDLRTRAIEMCLPYTRRLARRYHGLGEAEADLRQVAALGLVKAVDGYDPPIGTDFGAYALPTVVGELKRHFRDHAWAVRVPRGLQERVLDVNHAQATLTQRLGRPPSVADLAAYLDADREQIAEATTAANAYRSVSLYSPLGDTGLAPLDRLGEPDTELDSIDLRESITPLLRQLPRRDKQIVAMRFYGNMTQAQIAARLGISQMQVSRLLQRIVFRLRRTLLSEC